MVIGFTLLILVVLAAGIILLQIFLSKREGKWFGLILPAISCIISLLLVISIVAYTNVGITSQTVSQSGTIVSHQIEDTTSGFGDVVITVITTFLLANIPTVVLITIYAACRGNRKKQLALEKMRAQDL